MVDNVLENRVLDKLEEVTLISVDSVREYLNYSGSNKEYHQRAKIGAAMLTGYTRLFGSLTNRQMVALTVEKHDERKSLPDTK